MTFWKNCSPCKWLNCIAQSPFSGLIWLFLGAVFFFAPFLVLLSGGCAWKATINEWGYGGYSGCDVCTSLNLVDWAPTMSAYHFLLVIVLFFIGVLNIILLLKLKKYCCEGNDCKVDFVLRLLGLLAATLFLYWIWSILFLCFASKGGALIFAIIVLLATAVTIFTLFQASGLFNVIFWLFVPFALWVLYLAVITFELAFSGRHSCC